MAAIFELLGGKDAVVAVVETFYRKVLVDTRINTYFDDVDMDKQMIKQTAFLTMVLGGPVHYSGRDLREGHRHLVERGLNDMHVDTVIELLGDALREHGVGADMIASVAAIAESVRDDVLGRSSEQR